MKILRLLGNRSRNCAITEFNTIDNVIRYKIHFNVLLYNKVWIHEFDKVFNTIKECEDYMNYIWELDKKMHRKLYENTIYMINK